MEIIFINTLCMFIFALSWLSFASTYIKAVIDGDVISYKKSCNFMVPIFVSFLTLYTGHEISNNIVYTALLLLDIFTYIYIFLYNTKWNHYELDLDKKVNERFLRECTNFTEEDFTKFKKTMSREEQICWLKSLTYIEEEVNEKCFEDGTKTIVTTEIIVPLIESDEDLEEFESLLKQTK